MSFISARPCPGFGPRFRSCPNIIRGSVRLCPECEVYATADNKKRDKKRDESADRKFLHSAAWRRIRLSKLGRDPLCERCLIVGRERAATLVHHRDENQLNVREENLQSLCNNCHEEIHGPNRFRSNK